MSNIDREKMILIGGESTPKDPEKFRNECERLGELLAQEGFSLILGPAGGVSAHVERGFSRITEHGQTFFYKPKSAVMTAAGEELGFKVDRTIYTKTGYPRRNLIQLEAADALIVITGRDGTVTEVVNAVRDYHKPVAILEDSGEIVDIIKGMSTIRDKVFFGKTPEELVAYVNGELFKKNSLEGNILVST